MSSYTIDKKEYIKAAGIVAGIAQESDRGHSRDKFWLYDYETQRNSTPEDFYRRFSECFTMNALSVQEQYQDEDPWTDGNEYRAEFSVAISAGKKLYNHGGDDLKNAVMELRQFFHSAIYQTEKYAYMFKMQMYFHEIMDQLTPLLWGYEPESWGNLTIKI